MAVRTTAVYPRVGGGNALCVVVDPLAVGLSPRGRGKPAASVLRLSASRSIPAWAGETYEAVGAVADAPVYPRVGGGNSDVPTPRSSISGLSPRGRGKLSHIQDGVRSSRSIPAWAGETNLSTASRLPCGVYPRVGGGNHSVSVLAKVFVGLSPRGRGKQA